MQPATGGKEAGAAAPADAAPADAGRRDFCGRTARLGSGLLLAMTVGYVTADHLLLPGKTLVEKRAP